MVWVQIWWDNTLYGGWRVIARRVVAWALYILLLCVALAVQTVLAVLAKIEADNNKKDDVGRQGDEEKGALSVRCSKPPCHSIPSMCTLCTTSSVLPRCAVLCIACVGREAS